MVVGGSSDKILHQQEAYTSHNTTQLSVEEVKEKLLTLPYIQEELKNMGRVKP